MGMKVYPKLFEYVSIGNGITAAAFQLPEMEGREAASA
jgi:hypothetical protein